MITFTVQKTGEICRQLSVERGCFVSRSSELGKKWGSFGVSSIEMGVFCR